MFASDFKLLFVSLHSTTWWSPVPRVVNRSAMLVAPAVELTSIVPLLTTAVAGPTVRISAPLSTSSSGIRLIPTKPVSEVWQVP